MKNWDEKDEVGQCLSDRDMEDAKFVCQHIGIPFQEVNFVKDYWNEVFRYLNYSFIYTIKLYIYYTQKVLHMQFRYLFCENFNIKIFLRHVNSVR